VCAALGVNPPLWLQRLLKISETGTWDSFAYKTSIARLERLHLIRPVTHDIRSKKKRTNSSSMAVSWPGFTMHGLVRWRTGARINQIEYKRCRIILMAACCRTCNESEDSLDSRAAMDGYMAGDGRKWQTDDLKLDGVANLCTVIGRTFLGMKRFVYAESFFLDAYRCKISLFRKSGQATATIEANLRRLHDLGSQICNDNDDEVQRKYFEEKAKASSTSMPRTTESMMLEEVLGYDPYVDNLRDWLGLVAAMAVGTTCEEPRCEVMQNQLKKHHDGSASEFESQLCNLADLRRSLGEHSPIVSALWSNVAHSYSTFGKPGLERKHLDDLLQYDPFASNKYNTYSMRIRERLAFCWLRSDDVKVATKMMRSLCEVSRTALGDDDPRTRLRELHLEMMPTPTGEAAKNVDENNLSYWLD
jgi:hypothetical protein